MKKLRRMAAIFAALLLGLVAWFAVILCSRTEGELRLGRELSSGRIVARVPAPKQPFFKLFAYDPPILTGRYLQPSLQNSGPLPPSAIFVRPSQGATELWYLNLDPADKTWELEVTENRTVRLQFGAKAWRVGTKTRIWRTQRNTAARVRSGTNSTGV